VYFAVLQKSTVARAVTWSLQAKKDMLVSLGAMMRAEMDNEITTGRRS